MLCRMVRILGASRVTATMTALRPSDTRGFMKHRLRQIHHCGQDGGSLRAEGKKVGIVAVDPTSPFTGGAILGDRIRMQRHATDEGVFIRSLATRGAWEASPVPRRISSM
jgi:hypothetical protein